MGAAAAEQPPTGAAAAERPPTGPPAAQRPIPEQPSAGRPPRAPQGTARSGEAVRFVALGDSLTEGLGDPLPGGGWRGWAVLLAAALGERPEGVQLVNLAVSGALAADVAERQLPVARALRPRFASLVVGANDTLRAAFAIERVAAALDRAYGALSGDGTVVLTACLPDPGRMLGLPAPLARPLGRRMRAVNTVVHALAARHGGVHLHLAEYPWVTERACWSVDRLHPSERGHRLLARGFHAQLAAAGLPVGPAPALTLDGRPPTRTGSALWMATKGTRWVVDRCTDLLPGLLALAAREYRHSLAGTGRLLDAAADRTTRAALAALPGPKAAAALPGPKAAACAPGAATMTG
ncbi:MULTISPECIES: SGNH/GDSL hydrolase family protein [Streptomyces]|uniref:SGNH/GDSL hydrolase family protein n=1 Tax=Streptomyces siderophoricus TaxID=2802281 RepID=A0ABS1MNE5_9ACTN|nr:SGNH/GDSL hydrolase family protein [Streptomyces sp. 9-7]MBL1089272.1 SGNH/GDSL hydrolase family protein [Streptomyces sp. 9-7]